MALQSVPAFSADGGVTPAESAGWALTAFVLSLKSGPPLPAGEAGRAGALGMVRKLTTGKRRITALLCNGKKGQPVICSISSFFGGTEERSAMPAATQMSFQYL